MSTGLGPPGATLTHGHSRPTGAKLTHGHSRPPGAKLTHGIHIHTGQEEERVKGIQRLAPEMPQISGEV